MNWPSLRTPIAASVLILVGLSAQAQPSVAGTTLPDVPFPAENPFTEEKRILGKILFWDEQLSSDNTTSCGTCHIPSAAGNDPRLASNPGQDGIAGSFDDISGSFGVVRASADDQYEVDAVFGLMRQVTGRAANSPINAAFADDIFWDGRATSEFIDPESGAQAIASGGALESQAVGPPLSSAEMAHAGRNWTQITTKLASARPLALALNLTSDQAAAIAASPSYPDLFGAAFGDPAITARRIAFAIATYERTLISDQSPWDHFQKGDTEAMTPEQLAGFSAFQAARCDICHTPPLFTDNQFRNIGLRPIALDSGREAITGLASDRGRFKTPSLRNVGLKETFMHSGTRPTLTAAVDFYVGPPAFPNNVDPFMGAVSLSPGQIGPIVTFLAEALTDPRVVTETFPFDRPILRSELPPNPVLIGAGTDNGSGFIPPMIALTPPNAGNAAFKLGTAGLPEGTSLSLYRSLTPPTGGLLTPTEILGPFVATTGAGVAPAATAHWPIPDDAALNGVIMYFQWVVDATGARSPVAMAKIFCGTGGCPPAPCPADTNNDGTLSPADFSAWIAAFNAQSPACDQNGDTLCTPADFSAWIAGFNAGC